MFLEVEHPGWQIRRRVTWPNMEKFLVGFQEEGSALANFGLSSILLGRITANHLVESLQQAPKFKQLLR
jgi:hypothetical protein